MHRPQDPMLDLQKVPTVTKLNGSKETRITNESSSEVQRDHQGVWEDHQNEKLKKKHLHHLHEQQVSVAVKKEG